MQMQRLNITLPYNIARDLRRSVPARQRSRYIARALEEELKKKVFKKELIKSAKAQRKIIEEIQEDFKYADAESLKYLP